MSNVTNKQTTSLAMAAAALLVLLGAGAAVYALTTEPEENMEHLSTTSHSHHEHKDAPAALAEQAAIVIEYMDEGFPQASYIVKVGDLVRVENNSTAEMYFAAGEHEHHDITSPVNLGVIEPGEASSFIAPQAGSYLFHNHDNDEHTGTLTVQ